MNVGRYCPRQAASAEKETRPADQTLYYTG